MNASEIILNIAKILSDNTLRQDEMIFKIKKLVTDHIRDNLFKEWVGLNRAEK